MADIREATGSQQPSSGSGGSTFTAAFEKAKTILQNAGKVLDAGAIATANAGRYVKPEYKGKIQGIVSKAAKLADDAENLAKTDVEAIRRDASSNGAVLADDDVDTRHIPRPTRPPGPTGTVGVAKLPRPTGPTGTVASESINEVEIKEFCRSVQQSESSRPRYFSSYGIGGLNSFVSSMVADVWKAVYGKTPENKFEHLGGEVRFYRAGKQSLVWVFVQQNEEHKEVPVGAGEFTPWDGGWQAAIQASHVRGTGLYPKVLEFIARNYGKVRSDKKVSTYAGSAWKKTGAKLMGGRFFLPDMRPGAKAQEDSTQMSESEVVKNVPMEIAGIKLVGKIESRNQDALVFAMGCGVVFYFAEKRSTNVGLHGFIGDELTSAIKATKRKKKAGGDRMSEVREILAKHGLRTFGNLDNSKFREIIETVDEEDYFHFRTTFALGRLWKNSRIVTFWCKSSEVDEVLLSSFLREVFGIDPEKVLVGYVGDGFDGEFSSLRPLTKGHAEDEPTKDPRQAEMIDKAADLYRRAHTSNSPGLRRYADAMMKKAKEAGEVNESFSRQVDRKAVLRDMLSRARSFEETDEAAEAKESGDEDDYLYAFDYWLSQEHQIDVRDDGLVQVNEPHDHEVRRIVGDNWVVMYHHTATGRNGRLIKAIEKEGLRPSSKDVNRHGMPSLGVYLTTWCSGPAVRGYHHNAVGKHGGDESTVSVVVKLSELEEDSNDDDVHDGRYQAVVPKVGPDRILDESSDASKNKGTWNGRQFWIGTASYVDGKIERVYTYEKALASDFHHSNYMAEDDRAGLSDETRFAFWIDENGNIKMNTSWTKKDCDVSSLVQKIRDQITIGRGQATNEANVGFLDHPAYDEVKKGILKGFLDQVRQVVDLVGTHVCLNNATKAKQDTVRRMQFSPSNFSVKIDGVEVGVFVSVAFVDLIGGSPSPAVLDGFAILEKPKRKVTDGGEVNVLLRLNAFATSGNFEAREARQRMEEIAAHEAVHVIQSVYTALASSKTSKPGSYENQRLEVQAFVATVVSQMESYLERHPEAGFEEALGSSKIWRRHENVYAEQNKKKVLSKVAQWWATRRPTLTEGYEGRFADLLKPVGKSAMVGSETGEFVRDGISKFSSRYGSTRYVMAEKGEIIGVLQVVSTDKKRAIIANAFVVPERQRQGIGSLLLKRARQDFETVDHSSDMTDAAKGWAKKNAVDESTVLDVPVVSQKFHYDCGAAVLRAVARMVGVDASQEHFIDAIGPSKRDGVSTEKLSQAIRSLGVKVRVVTDMTPSKLRRHVRLGHPVVTTIIAHGGGHWVIAVGESRGKFYFMDPYVGDVGHVSAGDMDERWRTSNERHPRTAIVVMAKTRKRDHDESSEIPAVYSEARSGSSPIDAATRAKWHLNDEGAYGGPEDHAWYPTSNVFIPNETRNIFHPENVEFHKKSRQKEAVVGCSSEKPVDTRDGHYWEKLTSEPFNPKYHALLVADGVHRCKATVESGEKWVLANLNARPMDVLDGGVPFKESLDAAVAEANDQSHDVRGWEMAPGQKDADYKAAEPDEFYYHVTTKKAAPGIIKNGLRPNRPALFSNYGNHSKGRVFLCDKDGVFFWKSKVEDHLFDSRDWPEDTNIEDHVAVLRIPKEKVSAKLDVDSVGSSDSKANAWMTGSIVEELESVFLEDSAAEPVVGERPIDKVAHWFKNFDHEHPMIYFFGAEPVDKDEWLIHFTESPSTAEKIVRDGFKYGVSWEKIGPQKFGFALLAQSPDVHSVVRAERYGTNAVVFTSDAAISSFHESDREEQVVFQIERTSDRRLVQKDEDSDEWYATLPGGEVFKSKRISDVIEKVTKGSIAEGKATDDHDGIRKLVLAYKGATDVDDRRSAGRLADELKQPNPVTARSREMLGDGSITLYRGSSDGGHDSFSGWTTDPVVATNFALDLGAGSVVAVISVESSDVLYYDPAADEVLRLPKGRSCYREDEVMLVPGTKVSISKKMEVTEDDEEYFRDHGRPSVDVIERLTKGSIAEVSDPELKTAEGRDRQYGRVARSRVVEPIATTYLKEKVVEKIPLEMKSGPVVDRAIILATRADEWGKGDVGRLILVMEEDADDVRPETVLAGLVWHTVSGKKVVSQVWADESVRGGMVMPRLMEIAAKIGVTHASGPMSTAGKSFNKRYGLKTLRER